MPSLRAPLRICSRGMLHSPSSAWLPTPPLGTLSPATSPESPPQAANVETAAMVRSAAPRPCMKFTVGKVIIVRPHGVAFVLLTGMPSAKVPRVWPGALSP